MKINGFVFLVLGLFVAIVSKLAGEKLVVFLYFGILLSLFGILKLVLQQFESKRAGPQQIAQQTLQPNHYVSRQGKVTKQEQFYVHFCPRCGYPIHHQDNYCARCGTRIR